MFSSESFVANKLYFISLRVQTTYNTYIYISRGWIALLRILCDIFLLLLYCSKRILCSSFICFLDIYGMIFFHRLQSLSWHFSVFLLQDTKKKGKRWHTRNSSCHTDNGKEINLILLRQSTRIYVSDKAILLWHC